MGLSNDGSVCIVNEQGEATSGGSYLTYLRRIDGSPAVRLGDGFLGALSPDGTTLATLRMDLQATIELLPVSAGKPTSLPIGDVMPVSLNWYPDGRALLVTGLGREGRLQLYRQEVAGGPPHAASPLGYGWTLNGGVATPDGAGVIAIGPERKLYLCPSDGSAPRALPGLEAGLLPIRLSADGSTLYCGRSQESGAEILRYSMQGGRLESLRGVRSPAPVGTMFVSLGDVSPDGLHHLYNVVRITSQLFLVQGLR
jgi:hypothetical protein